VQPDTEFSRRFPDEMPMRIRIVLRDGRTISVEKGDYEGFHTRPMSWDHVVEKYERLATPYADTELRRAIVQAVAGLETIRIRELTQLLVQVGRRN